MKNKTLFDKLEEYSESGALPMHMPGHKRRASSLRSLDKLDITEIDGFDDLHDPHGVIADIEKRAALLWGAERSHILVNGSTCGILAGIYALAKRGDRIVMARNCHKSVYHAVELLDLKPTFIMPEILCGGLFCGKVSAEQVSDAIKDCPEKPALVVITSPTYEGVISDISGIAGVCRSQGVPLLVDEAHGAHLDVVDGFSGGAVKAGADIVIQSLHKTLSCLTQTAVAHVRERFDEPFMHALDIFETSSPSYLLMASADECITELQENSKIISGRWNAVIGAAARKLAGMKNLELFECPDKDKSKLVILTGKAGISGRELADMLRNRFDIEVEMSAPYHIIAMSGEGDSEETLSQFADALFKIDGELVLAEPAIVPTISALPPVEMSITEALSAKNKRVHLTDALGKVSADYIIPYPPGIPLIIPGERFTAGTIKAVSSALPDEQTVKIVAAD